jgi:ankyrin repeat protein
MKRVTYQLTTLAVSFVLLNCTPENDGGDSQVLSELPLEQRKRIVSKYQKIKKLAISGNKDIVQSIIRTDFTTLDDLEKTYLIKYAIENGDCEDPNKEDEIGETPLLWAIRTQVTTFVEMLVKQTDIDLNKKNNGGKTPLAYAQDRRAIDIVKLLIKNGADVNEEYKGYKETILSWAFRVNDPELIHLVIEKSNTENLNKKNGDIGFPLFEAILNISSTDPIKRNRFIEIAKLLINKEGVNLNIINNKGQTPLAIAKQNSLNELQELLEGKGAKQ